MLAPAAAHAITMTFSPEELEILTRAVGEWCFNAPVDAYQTDGIRALLERLRTARPVHVRTKMPSPVGAR